MNELPSIVRERLRMARTAPAGNHPDPDLLAAFAEQALPDRERSPLLEHLARCASCRDVLAFSTPPAESVGAVTRDTARTYKGPWFSWPVLRWGTLAACVVIVGTAVLLQHDRQQRYVSSEAAPEQRTIAPHSQASEADAVTNNVVAPMLHEEAKQAAAPRINTKNKKESFAPRPAPAAPSLSLTPAPEPSRASDFALNAVTRDKQSTEFHGAAVGGLVSAQIAPAPPPAPTLRKDERQNLPLERLDIAPKANETVEVQAEAAPVPATNGALKVESLGRAKAAPASSSTVLLETTPGDQGAAAPAPSAKVQRDRSSLFRSDVMRWTISSDGQLQRSLDSGKTWQPVEVASNATFRALSANGPDIWVGGAAGLLYHSTDAGTRWTQIKPVIDKVALSADIAAIEFTDPRHGKLTTANGEVWLTTDTGQTWQKKN
jgi:hypothetical protein